MIVCTGGFGGATVEVTLEAVELGEEDLTIMRRIVNGPAREYAPNVVSWLYGKDRR